jgi:transforming growth factor-beta-induced protein
VVTLDSAETVATLPVFITAGENGVYVNDAEVTMTDVPASNGVIHVIDRVLIPPSGDLVTTAVAADDFTALTGAVTDAGLVETLSSDTFTVFAPLDAAFDALMELPTGEALVDVLTYHVIPGAVFSHSLSDGLTVQTVNGASVTFSVSPEGAMIDDANIVGVDIVTTNGVIHVIDKVIIPPAE